MAFVDAVLEPIEERSGRLVAIAAGLLLIVLPIAGVFATFWYYAWPPG